MSTLVRSGIKLLKYYFDISKPEQKKRLGDRKSDPLKQWKASSIDTQALSYWKQYSAARNEMLVRSHNAMAPWTVVRADDKHLPRLNVIRDMLTRLHYKGKNKRLLPLDPQVLFLFKAARLKDGHLAK